MLITLTIIGIVAALTIPNLMKNYQHKTLETSFKEAYSLVSAAVQNATTDSGSATLYDYAESNGYDATYDLIHSKFKTVKKANHPYGPFTDNRDKRMHTGDYQNGYFLSNGMWLKAGYDYMDGFAALGFGPPKYLLITVDTNGAKKPNRWGYDVFKFPIDKTTGMITANPGNIWYWGIHCSKTNASGGNGWYVGHSCVYYAFTNKDPDNSTKGYWDSLE